METAVPPRRRLDSWKAIAAHLGREVRTAQRWERQEGLPVHRLAHQKRGSVYAFAEELDAWVAARSPVSQPDLTDPSLARSPRESWRIWLIAGGGSLLLVLAVLGALWAHGLRPRRPPLTNSPLHVDRLFAAVTVEGHTWDLLPYSSLADALALSNSDQTLYFASEEAHTVTAMDLVSRHTRAIWHFRFAPSVLAPSSDGKHIFVGSLFGGALTALATNSGQVTTLPVSAGIRDMKVSPRGHSLYLALGYGGLARLNLATMQVTRFATPLCPVVLAFTPGGRRLYVGYQCGGPGGRPGRDAIAMFDPVSQRFAGTLGGNLPAVITALAVTPDGNEVWASAGDVCTAAYDHHGCPPDAVGLVYVFSTSTNQLLARIPLPHVVNHIGFFADSSRALLDGLVVDTTSHQILEAVTGATAGFAIAQNQHVYVALPQRRAVASFAAPQGDCTAPPEGLLAWWPGDGSAADLHGILTAKTSPALGYAPGRLGQAFAFNGTAQLALGHDDTLQRSFARGLTLAAWVKPLDTRSGTLLARHAGSAGGRASLSFDADARLHACFAAIPSCLRTQQPWMPGVWHFVTLAGNRRGITLSLDGRAQQTLRAVPARGGNAGDWVAGRGYRGLLDEIAIYDHALSQSEIQRLMALPGCATAVPPRSF